MFSTRMQVHTLYWQETSGIQTDGLVYSIFWHACGYKVQIIASAVALIIIAPSYITIQGSPLVLFACSDSETVNIACCIGISH